MTLLDRLLDFATQKAPICLDRFPAPFPHPPNAIRATNTEFLLRVALEGRDILDRGDSQLSDFRFNENDVNSAYRGFLVLNQLVFDPDTFPENIEDTFSAARNSLLKISTYHEDKISISKSTKVRARKDIPRAWASMQKMYDDGNFKALLEFYPGFETLMELDNDNTTQTPFSSSCIVSLDDARHTKNIADIFEREAKKGGNHIGIGLTGMIAWLGKPEHIRRLQNEVSLCDTQIERNSPVLKAIHNISEQMKNVLEGPPSNIINFRSAPAPGV